MDKKLLNHEQFIKTEIEKFEHNLKKAETEGEQEVLQKGIAKLYKYHQMNVRNFQHERLIHLIVTFFFGGLLIASIIAVFLLTLLPISNDYSLLNTLNFIICGLLFVVEIFYVRHYYQLENGTQKLYPLSQKLYELTNK